MWSQVAQSALSDTYTGKSFTLGALNTLALVFTEQLFTRGFNLDEFPLAK